MARDTIRIGVSSCLLGNPVRYNGGHQHDRYITDTLGRFFDFLPVCPEVECGLPIPRETMRLEGEPANPRLLTSKTKIDHTARMQSWAARRVWELEGEGLHGFIFKSRSPSSGMERVKVYGEGAKITKTGVGMFARAFMAHFPRLPVEEDGRLHDPTLRGNFITRVFTCKRWRTLLSSQRSRSGLVAFHTTHKLLLMSHSESLCRDMGRLVAAAKAKSLDELFAEYERLLIKALRLQTTVKKNTNVLQHMLGYFKQVLSAEEKQEMLEIIDQYHREYVPLIVPVTLINHFVRKYGEDYLACQVYLHPHPIELRLRNHV